MGVSSLEEEFREFVTARSAALLRTAYLLTGDWGIAEDLLQTALTKTYLAWKRLGEIGAVEPYTRRVLVNTATSWWRRRWWGERPTEHLPERAGADQHQEALERDVMWRHLRALPPRQRAVLVLRYYEDLSEAQIAELMDISPGTVKSQAARALATLRARLERERSRPETAPARPVPPPPRAPAPSPLPGATRDRSAASGSGQAVPAPRRPTPLRADPGAPGPATPRSSAPRPAPFPTTGGKGR